MQDHLLDATLAYRAELLGSVVAHTADIRRTVDTLRAVATTLIDTNSVVGSALRGYGCGYLYALGNHVSPLRIEINKCGDVMLPGLVVQRVHLVVIVAILVEILVAKTCKGVPELVDNNGTERGVVRRSERI